MLIIDDSRAMRGFLKALAAEFAFTTVEAVDGRTGLDALIRNDPNEPFDLALVDWDMPRMTGLPFVQFVRRNRHYDHYDALKLRMVTTSNTEEKISLALDAGANEFLMKPVTKEALEEKLLILGLRP
jgi:two-component system, chemotaxis family, chemotaxis protein CheY